MQRGLPDLSLPLPLDLEELTKLSLKATNGLQTIRATRTLVTFQGFCESLF